MKKFLFLGAYLVALASQPVMAQTTRPEVVVVQTIASAINGGGEDCVVISYGDGKIEVVTFNNYFGKNDEQKGLGAGAVGYQKVFAKLYQEGYTLKSTFSDGARNQSTLVFVKEK